MPLQELATHKCSSQFEFGQENNNKHTTYNVPRSYTNASKLESDACLPRFDYNLKYTQESSAALTSTKSASKGVFEPRVTTHGRFRL